MVKGVKIMAEQMASKKQKNYIHYLVSNWDFTKEEASRMIDSLKDAINEADIESYREQ